MTCPAEREYAVIFYSHAHSLTDQASPDEGSGVMGGAPGGPLGAGGGPGAQPVPPQPLFHPDDVNVQSLTGLTPHLQINPQVGNTMYVCWDEHDSHKINGY